MNRFAVMASTSQTLSIAAMEEASRLGQREADLDHLLLALTLSTHPAGQVLRASGVTLDAVRLAIAEQRAVELESIGISAEASTEPGPIDFHQTGGYEWSARCLEILSRASSRGKNGDAESVLRELLNDRSGLIDDLLARVGTSSAALVSRLDEVADLAVHRPRSGGRGEASGFTETFVPASVAEVWDLLSRPARMPEWDVLCGRVELPEGVDTASAGASWASIAPERRPDGRPLRIRPRFARRRVETLAVDTEALIAWRFSYPGAPRSIPMRVTIALTPAAGGTQLEIALAWRRSRGWRQIVGFPMRPLQRFAIWIQLTHISGGISRVFR
ncbi:SRPBCC family protein [Microbacterium sp. SA39]|uniref:SRPBCC family protein n=1 Tax=Microbacterium sp. SA39 TaxID=1263625 RepID=UPI0005FA0D47|nr:SRPBCC family protein [Microbacterium sp. SA39]KJQ55841.1 Polyketide cyclase / dehydrase and lipid transport [Microbacterium sp. SA39]